MNKITQRNFMKSFNDNNREQFNPQLFKRSEDDIIEDIKKVILSCQRSRYFVIKVHQFKVINDYDEIYQILYNYEEDLYKKKPKKRDNPYDFVDLKTTDMKLLIVTYYIESKGKSEYVDVIIAIPRIVNKYYFRISGNMYSALYQLVESTYNSATSATTLKDNVTLKSIFTPIKAYRNNVTLLTTSNEEVNCIYYTMRVSTKSFNSIKPFLARGGFYEGLAYLGLNYISITQKDPKDDTMYTFMKHSLYISVPKYMFDNDVYVQSFIYGLVSAITKECTYSNIFTKHCWIKLLGEDYNNSSVDRGLSVLDSLESVYDLLTQEDLRLPGDYKRNIYDVLRWMLREFSNLMSKDNLDITVKRIRFSKYIASLYGMKLSTGIYRISDNRRKNINKDSIRRIIKIPPMTLISAITKCNLVNYRNLVNDLDSTLALKYSRKGVSGMGDQTNKSVPKIYKYIDPSSIGIFDLDDSPKSDPGISGSITPLVKMNDWSFSNYEEPNEWESGFNELTKNYKALVGKKEVITLQKELLNITNEELESIVDDSIDTVKELMSVIRFAEDEIENIEVDLEDDTKEGVDTQWI